MWLLVILFLLTLITTLVFFLGGPQKVWTDKGSPENLLIYREPLNSYSDQHVNLWINKKWASDGSRIPCFMEYVNQDTKNLVIYSHGNAENLLNCMQFVRELSQKLRSNVLVYEYSGYGLNSYNSFERSEEGVNLTLKTVYEEMVQVHNYPPENIFLWGYSLGSGPSTALAAELSNSGTLIRGLILQSAFTSLLKVAQEKVFEHADKIFKNRWYNETLLKKVKVPILLLHGEDDTVVKKDHALALKKSNPQAKLILIQNTKHNDFAWPRILKEVFNWVKYDIAN